MLSISEIVAKTEKMFDLFNDHFYAGELARPAITVSFLMSSLAASIVDADGSAPQL